MSVKIKRRVITAGCADNKANNNIDDGVGNGAGHREITNQQDLLLPDMHPVLDRVYRARNITSAAQLQASLKHLLPYSSLFAVEEAAAIIHQSMAQQESILIVGDFDADGATSTAVALRALEMMGAQQINFLVPNRFEFGYGLTPEIVEVARQFNPQLIITVDNGISSIDGVNAANALGIKVVVTDHHLAGNALPAAAAIVNPNQPGDQFPSKALAGVGTIFYVMLALRAQLRNHGWFEAQNIPDPNLAQLLDLVALGTVADVVPLDHNNRILVSQGLARIRAGACCAGIKALIKVSGRDASKLTAQDLGFALGPRLNAAGRLEDMSMGIVCLLTDNEEKANVIAEELNALNIERRRIEQTMKTQAMDALDELNINGDGPLPGGLCIYDASWHQGVIGILASRIKDKFHRPVIAFADADTESGAENRIIKGSARSVPGFHIRDALDAVATSHPGILSKFGGHAMAAGLSLNQQDFEAFKHAFEQEVNRHLGEDDFCHVIHSDGELTVDDIGLPLAQQIQTAGPWGQAFPAPLFDGYFDVIQKRIVAEKHLKLVLRVPGSTTVVDAIAFNTVDDTWPRDVQQVKVAYKLDVNEYRGVCSAQFIVEFIEPVGANGNIASALVTDEMTANETS